MEYSDVIYHSNQIFELNLKITPVWSCDPLYMEYNDVIYHSDQIFELNLKITPV